MNAPMNTPQTALALYVSRPALIGPGLDNFNILSALHAENAQLLLAKANIPSTALLPPAERRRVGATVKLAISVAQQALEGCGHSSDTLATVFASSGGDGENCHTICEALATAERTISPTRFTNSVHNAPSGYWGIAAKARPVSTSLCAHDGSFAAGLLEAATQCVYHSKPVLLIVYDAPYPEPLHGARPIPDAFGVALVLTHVRDVATLASLRISMSRQAPTKLQDTVLEQIRSQIPAARSLPLLISLAKRSVDAQAEEECVIELFDNLSLSVRISN